MQPRSWILALLAAAAPAAAQTPATEAPRPAAGELVPGVLPEGASPGARAAWQELTAATAGAREGGVRAFDLEFDATARQERQSNDFRARYRFLEEGPRAFVRITMSQSGRERLRGPEGDFLLQQGQPPLRIEGRELREDKRELDEAVGIARTFAGLSDPRRLRIARLELLAAPPRELPSNLAKLAAGLRWLELSTPDFRRGASDGALYRVRLGLEPKTHLPVLAMVAREQGPALELETAQLLQLGDFQEVDGFKIPREVRSFQPDMEQVPRVFSSRSSLELYFLKGTLRPALTSADFVPGK